LWRGWKKRMITQNRQKSNAKKIFRDLGCFLVFKAYNYVCTFKVCVSYYVK